jgi:hypothetical protein
MAASPTPTLAATCPAIVDHTSGFGATDCNDLITINANGSVTETFPQATPYDGSDDNYIGILNNSSQVLNHIAISGPASPRYGGIFGGMDGDGICDTARFSSTGFTCTGTVIGVGAGENYAPVGVTLDGVTANSGFVDITGGLQPGELIVFSLEEPASAGGIVIRTPKPATLALVSAGLIGLGVLRRRKSL